MAWTQSDLDRLDTAIVSGVKSITFADGRRTEYQSLADMRQARADVKAELAGTSATARRRPRFIVGRMGRCR